MSSMGPNSKTDWGRLRELAEEKRDVCARRLGEAMAAMREAQRKLQMLVDYRQDYGQRMTHAGQGGIAAERLNNFRRFIAHLERAVDQQRAIADAAQAEVERVQLALSVAQRSLESFQVLATRQQSAESAVDRREQQKLQDEYASRLLPRFLSGAD